MAKPTRDDVGFHAQREERHDGAEQRAGEEAREDGDVPGRIDRDDHRGETAEQHLAFERHIERARQIGDEAAERGEQQRRRGAQHGDEEGGRKDRGEEGGNLGRHQFASSAAAAGRGAGSGLTPTRRAKKRRPGSEKEEATSRMMMAGDDADHLRRHVGADVHELRALAQIAIGERHEGDGERPGAGDDGDQDALEGEAALEQHGEIAEGLACTIIEPSRPPSAPATVIAETMMKVALMPAYSAKRGLWPTSRSFSPQLVR